MKKKICFSIFALTCVTGYGQTPVTNYTIEDVTSISVVSNSTPGWNASGNYNSGTNYTNFYGTAQGGGGGLERTVKKFTTGSGASLLNYSSVPSSSGLPFDLVTIKRHPLSGGDTTNSLYEVNTDNGTDLYYKPGYISSLANLINSFVCNRGSDNLFTNVGSTQANIERVDMILTGGIVCVSPTKQGFLINERNGNDPLKFAAITSLDGSNNVTTLGNLIGMTASQWGKVGPAILTKVMSKQNEAANLSPKQDITSQTISGVFISLSDLGISVGQTVFGIAVFPNDVTSSMNLISLTDVPVGTVESNGGSDLMAGGGFFVEDAVMPVTLSAFNATAGTHSILVNWITSVEINTLQFEVERSTDGSTFSKIATVAPKGPGNYQFVDQELSAGNTYYYRLKMVSADGSYQLSEIKSVSLAGAFKGKLYPNPVEDIVTVTLPASNINKPAIFSIYDQQGREVYKSERKKSITVEKINVAHLPKGVYQLKISLHNGASLQHSLYKK